MTNRLTVGDLPDGLVERLLETSIQDAAAAALVARFRRPPVRRPDLEYRCQTADWCTLLAVYVMPNALVCWQAGVRLSRSHSEKVQGIPRGSAEGAMHTDAKLVIPKRSFCIAPTDTDAASGGGWLAPDGPILLACKHQHGAVHARRVRAHLADPPADRLLLLKPRER